jgi:hypothetical protein
MNRAATSVAGPLPGTPNDLMAARNKPHLNATDENEEGESSYRSRRRSRGASYDRTDEDDTRRSSRSKQRVRNCFYYVKE